MTLRCGVRLNIQGEMGARASTFSFALDMARLAEQLGYDSVWIPDHVENAHLNREKPILEYWTTLTAIGALTRRVRLGGHSMNNTFRHPGLTAKIVCTLDQVTNGRVILAPGSGWFQAEAESYGFAWGERDERHARLKESLAVMKSLFTQTVTTFDGRYFQLKDAYCNPKPVQQPHPPFWIAGEGPLTQELVGEYADTWFMYSKPADDVAQLVVPMRERLNRPLDIALSAVCVAASNRDETLKWATMYAAERQHRFSIPPTVDDVMRSNLTGSSQEMVDRIGRWCSAGMTDLVIQPMPPVDGMRFFAEEVMPHLPQVS
ncbi:MAG: LLM class flavin-dependent oxidoreductase [Gammaproteobacteria bacterium]|nr:LLM class flavin-dependent oxidoreductase [Gammaproteobacteria bacterium]